MEDVHSPLELYRDSLKDLHAQRTSEFFECLAGQANIDQDANAALVAKIRDIEASIAASSGRNNVWKILRVAMVIGSVGCVVMAVMSHPVWLIGAVALVAALLVKLNSIIREISTRLQHLKELRDEKESLAWAQMEPLNRLYDWSIFASLVHKTLPTIQLDPFFTRGRLTNLCTSFGFDDSFSDSRSVKFAHSGLISGNPFVLAQTVNHWIGTKTYHGSLSINWTEHQRDSQGRSTTVSRHQTLHASVEKPFPEYANEATLIYGNRAAPDLSFSRMPSSLSGLENGVISNWRKNHAIRKLEAKSRKISDGKGFTVMANREFDALFSATDRDHEIQFRLLFTPLAQQEMLKLLKDKELGFGDKFAFVKTGMINKVESGPLNERDLSADPRNFRFYDFAQAEKFFNAYHNDLFRAFFFSFAPILVIPLYQQERPAEEIYAGILQEPSCSWEHEGIANYVGEGEFAHPASITRNILKTESDETPDGAQIVQVTAHGFRGVDRVDHVSVAGGDGRNHGVAVRWVQYIPVKQTSQLLVCDPAPEDAHRSDLQLHGWHDRFANHGIGSEHAFARRSIVAAML